MLASAIMLAHRNVHHGKCIMLDLNHSLSFSSVEITQWFAAGAPGTFKEAVDEKRPELAGMRRESGVELKVAGAPNQIITHVAANRRHYRLIQGVASPSTATRVIQDFTVDIPLSFDIHVDLTYVLYIAEVGVSSSARQAIVDGFHAFSPGTEPLSYMVDAARAAGVDLTAFQVVVCSELTCLGVPR
jgi:hypothetical protein